MNDENGMSRGAWIAAWLAHVERRGALIAQIEATSGRWGLVALRASALRPALRAEDEVGMDLEDRRPDLVEEYYRDGFGERSEW